MKCGSSPTTSSPDSSTLIENRFFITHITSLLTISTTLVLSCVLFFCFLFHHLLYTLLLPFTSCFYFSRIFCSDSVLSTLPLTVTLTLSTLSRRAIHHIISLLMFWWLLLLLQLIVIWDDFDMFMIRFKVKIKTGSEIVAFVVVKSIDKGCFCGCSIYSLQRFWRSS